MTAAAGTRTVRVAVVEDHPPTRAGLRSLLASADGIAVVADAPASPQLWPLLRRARPALVVVSCSGGWRGGLRFCTLVSRLPEAPALLAAAPATPARFVVAAILAGARGVAQTSEPTADVAAAARLVASGVPSVPALARSELAGCARLLDAGDLPVLAMALAGTSHPEIAAVLGESRRALDARVERMLGALCARG